MNINHLKTSNMGHLTLQDDQGHFDCDLFVSVSNYLSNRFYLPIIICL